jgi:hypothetical protein
MADTAWSCEWVLQLRHMMNGNWWQQADQQAQGADEETPCQQATVSGL